ITLENGKIPSHLLINYPLPISSEASEHGEHEHDCDCDNEAPRLPDTDELIMNGGDFTNDLGGQCNVKFKPNRSLEEIKFSTIVRTSDPQIQKYAITSTQLSDFKEDLSLYIRLVSETLFSLDYYRPYFQPKESNTPVSFWAAIFNAQNNTNNIYSQIETFSNQLQNNMEPVKEQLSVLRMGLENYSPDISTVNQYKQIIRAFSQLGIRTFNFLNQIRQFYDAHSDELRTAPIIGNLSKYKLTLYNAAIVVQKQLKAINQSFSDGAADRVELDIDNAIDWDESPTIYQATSIAHGHILCFHMRWKADGYSLGEVKYSKSLGPCEKEQIAILDWNRSDSATRLESQNYREGMQANFSRDRDVNEVINASLYESVKGKSAAVTTGFGTGSGGAAAGQYMGVMMGGVASLFGSIGVSGSVANQQGTRSLSSNTMQKLKDRINQSSQVVRSQRSVVIQSNSQNESVQATTKVIANKNLCHSVNYLFFEILKHYAIEQELVDVRECLFIPMKITSFNAEKAIRWKNILQPLMPDRELYLGFQSIEEIENETPVYNGILANQIITDFQGQLSLRFDIPLPDFDIPDAEDFVAWGADQFDAWNSSSWPIFYPILKTKFGFGSKESFFKAEFWKKRQSEKIRKWETKFLPVLVANFIENLKIVAVNDTIETDLELDITQLSKYRKSRSMDISLAISENTPTIRRSDITRIKIMASYEVPEHSRILVTSGSLSYRTAAMSNYIFRKNRINNDLSNYDSVSIITPLNKQELMDPSVIQVERAKKLLTFLNDHLIEMHQHIFLRMNKNTRFMMLDGIYLDIADQRSVASLVENEIVDIVGNCMVMPVNHGLRIDPVFKEVQDLFSIYNPDEPKAPFRVSLPTGGYFMEAVQGSCNSCEDLDYTKARFNGFGCTEEPTPIETLSTSSRNVTPPNLESKDFPTNIVNFQNVPQAPAPTDLNGVLSLLGKENAFRDLTGLTENQKNALAALQTNAESAVSMGQMATELVKAQMGQAMEKNIDRDLNRINDQKEKGNISEEDAKQLTLDLLGNKNNTSTPSHTGNAGDTDSVEMLDTLNTGIEALNSGAGSVRTFNYAPDGSRKEIELTESNKPPVPEDNSIKPLNPYDGSKIRTEVLSEYTVYPTIVERIMELDVSNRFFDLIEVDKGYVGFDLKFWEHGQTSDRPEIHEIYDTYALYINKYIDYRNQLLLNNQTSFIGVINEQVDSLFRDAMAPAISNAGIANYIEEEYHERYHPHSDSFSWLLLAGFLVHERDMRIRNKKLSEEQQEKYEAFRQEPPQEWIDYINDSNNRNIKYWFCCVQKIWPEYIREIDTYGERYFNYKDIATGINSPGYSRLPNLPSFFNGQGILYTGNMPQGSIAYYKYNTPEKMFEDLWIEAKSAHYNLFVTEQPYRPTLAIFDNGMPYGYNQHMWWREIGFDRALNAEGGYIPSPKLTRWTNEGKFSDCLLLLE
ncbi:MAG: hypothetical protein K0U54_04305, partial [Bacteroidetes bacterium]|nr:hypothetical protein [Bacteroidota bacterium]